MEQVWRKLSNLANFVHSNMPPGADYLDPVLSLAVAAC